MGRIATEPLVVPVLIVVYVIEAECDTNQSDNLISDTITGLVCYAVSHIAFSFGWAPAISKMTSLGSNAPI